MVATQNRPAEPTARPPAGDPSRSVHPRRTLPGGRAVVGGLLVAVAAVGIFAAVNQAGKKPKATVVVAAKDLSPGTVLEADDLREVRVELDPDLAHNTFRSIAVLDGGVLLSPLAKGEFVQGGFIGVKDRDGLPLVSIALPASDTVNASLQDGDRVDVWATPKDDKGKATDAPSLIVPNVLVIGLSSKGGTLGGSDDVTVTLAIRSRADMQAFIDAKHNSFVDLVRMTGAPKSPGNDSTNGPDENGDGKGDGTTEDTGGGN